MSTNSKLTITTKTKVWDKKGKDSITTTLSTTLDLNALLDANASHVQDPVHELKNCKKQTTLLEEK